MREAAERLRAVRRRMTGVVADLTADRLMGERGHQLEPPLWELGHVAWFQELWLLRHLDGRPPLRDLDGVYDSFNVSYRQRWDHDLPGLEETLAYGGQVLEQCCARLADRVPEGSEAWLHEMVAQHETMHAENVVCVRNSLGYPRPPVLGTRDAPPPEEGFEAADVEIPGGTFPLGAPRSAPFVFDNEQWAHPVEVAPFRIANVPVTNGAFARFVDAGGYTAREHWDKRGWEWRRRAGITRPLFWHRRDGVWCERRFGDLEPLEPWHPVSHINWHEARAYCRFAGRRLPTEAEWEMAAAWDPRTGRARPLPWGEEEPTPERANLDAWFGGPVDVRALSGGDSPAGCRQMIGNVWEWTASRFAPYPGFEPGPYAEYSAPYFGRKPVLRGGAWMTDARLIRNTWRNFFIRHRRNILAGFRTCPL